MSETGLNNVLNQSRTANTSQSSKSENRREILVQNARLPETVRDRIDQARQQTRQIDQSNRAQKNRNDSPRENRNTRSDRQTQTIPARVENVNQNGEVILNTNEGRIDVTVIDPEILQELETYAQQERAANTVRVQIRTETVNAQIMQTVFLSLPPETHAREVLPADVRHSTTPVDINLKASQTPEEPNIQTYVLRTSEPLPDRAFRLENITPEQAAQYISSPDIVENVALQTLQTTPQTAAINVKQVLKTQTPITVENTAKENPVLIAETPLNNVMTITTADEPQSRENLIQQALSAIKNATSDQSQNTQLKQPQHILKNQSQAGAIVTESIQNTPITVPSSPLAIANIVNAASVQITETTNQTNVNIEIPKQNTNIPTIKAGEINAQIIAQTDQGLPVIAVPSNQGTNPNATGTTTPENTLYFIIQAAFADIVPGTDITLIPQSTLGNVTQTSSEALTAQNTNPLSSALHMTLGTLPPLLTTDAWPVMNQIAHVLNQTAPQLAQSFTATIPSPATPAQITPAALFFMAAIGAGDMTGWLGQRVTDTLRRSGNGNLVTQLSQDGSSIARMGAEPIQSGDWRTMTLPMMWQNEIHKSTIYYKREDDSTDDETNGTKPVRFIMNIGFDKIGDVQLDALFKPERLDMVLRSQQTFSQTMHQDMSKLYTKSLKQAGISGELQFQTSTETWVTIKGSKEIHHQINV